MTLKNLSRTIGDESYVMNGAIGIGYVDKGSWGVGGTDEIGTFGSDNATLTIELPYDQGECLHTVYERQSQWKRQIRVL